MKKGYVVDFRYSLEPKLSKIVFHEISSESPLTHGMLIAGYFKLRQIVEELPEFCCSTSARIIIHEKENYFTVEFGGDT